MLNKIIFGGTRMEIKIAVFNIKGEVLNESIGNKSVLIVHESEYCDGDYVELICSKPGFFQVQFEDTLPPTLVYIDNKVKFSIPHELMSKICYSPRAFQGPQHLLTARVADEELVRVRRNLAFNPHDQHGTNGMYPHAIANVETRNEALFAARNAIDGIYANTSHYPYPYQSWGINQNPEAELKIEFGKTVDLDSVVLTLRADYPHDSYWVQGTVEFSDGSKETVSFKKTTERQIFPLEKKGVTWIILKELIKVNDDSPFPALTQIEAWGNVVMDEN